MQKAEKQKRDKQEKQSRKSKKRTSREAEKQRSRKSTREAGIYKKNPKPGPKKTKTLNND
jgi:hypothetical protein